MQHNIEEQNHIHRYPGSAGTQARHRRRRRREKSPLYPGCTERTLSACADHRCTDSRESAGTGGCLKEKCHIYDIRTINTALYFYSSYSLSWKRYPSGNINPTSSKRCNSVSFP